jgi:hypothetical protein
MPNHIQKANDTLYTTGVTFATETAYHGVLATLCYLEDLNSFIVLMGF